MEQWPASHKKEKLRPFFIGFLPYIAPLFRSLPPPKRTLTESIGEKKE
jgi:hypothetical protein